MHMQQQQPLNQMARPPLGPSSLNHPQPGLQQPPHHHQNFFSGNMNLQGNLQHYPQQNQHHPIHHQQHHHHHHQPQLMHHAPPMAAHHPHIQQGIGRNSPYYPNCILQTEFRIIELNRRLQCRPIARHPVSPLPNNPFDESLWWEKFASEFFEDDATLTIRIQDDKPVDYTIGRTLIPRFFRSYFAGGVTDLSINLRNPKEACIHPQLITLDCDQAFIITNNVFRHPAIPTNQAVVVHTEGHLILDFVSNSFDSLSIKSWRFYTKGCREYIDRSMTAMGLPNAFLVEPVTRQGLTKSTISYLKMCMIMEPMQDLMFQHRQSKMDPRSCLRKLLFDRYKFKSGDDNRVATNKRRKRKPSAVPAITGAATTKKSKASVNNSLGTNSGLNNINMMSPSGAPSFSLASQDVMVVGEPSMMGGDFGDDNERMITRLENTQYDPTASTPSNTEESDSMNTSTGNDNGLSNSNNIDSSIEIQSMSPSLLQQRQQQLQQPVQPTVQVMSQQNQMEKSSPQTIDQQQQQLQLQQQQQQPSQPPQHQRLQLDIQDQIQEQSVTSQVNPVGLIEHQDLQQHDEINQMMQQPITNDQPLNESDQISEDLTREDSKQHEITAETTKMNSILETSNDPNMMLGVNSVDQMENHTNSLQPMNEESNSNSLPCSTATTTTAIEQQQPVNNGVA